MGSRLKVCAEPGCPELQPETRCSAHRTNLYGREHKATRRQWAPKVAAGQVECWRCGNLIAPGSKWDLGHADDDPSRYRGPECVGCNRATSGR